MTKHLPAALAIYLTLLACSCGSEDPAKLSEAGYAELGRSDYQAALGKFSQALEKMDANHPEYLNTKLGEIEAWCYVDGNKAKDEFLGLAARHPDKLTTKDYRTVASNLTSAKQFNAAIFVLADGLARHPQDDAIKKLGETIKAEAQKAGDSAALDKLKGLGYL